MKYFFLFISIFCAKIAFASEEPLSYSETTSYSMDVYNIMSSSDPHSIDTSSYSTLSFDSTDNFSNTLEDESFFDSTDFSGDEKDICSPSNKVGCICSVMAGMTGLLTSTVITTVSQENLTSPVSKILLISMPLIAGTLSGITGKYLKKLSDSNKNNIEDL